MFDAEITPAFVQQALRLVADVEIDEAEAGAVLPIVLANRAAIAQLDRFDIRETRPAVMFDPTRA
ncbi:MAG: hypothetical protein IT307_04260 [Chloroflexi bacterium]|nr:hypothetical protein [Chloroflexota bacterium]